MKRRTMSLRNPSMKLLSTTCYLPMVLHTRPRQNSLPQELRQRKVDKLPRISYRAIGKTALMPDKPSHHRYYGCIAFGILYDGEYSLRSMGSSSSNFRMKRWRHNSVGMHGLQISVWQYGQGMHGHCYFICIFPQFFISASLFYVVNWVIGCALLPAPHPTIERVFYWGVSFTITVYSLHSPMLKFFQVCPILTLPLPVFVAWDFPRHHNTFYQIYVTCSTWSWWASLLFQSLFALSSDETKANLSMPLVSGS